jgi:hypothetical protein
MSKDIALVNSDKTVAVQDCCAGYIGSFLWRMMPDGRAARIEPCEADPEHPHLIFLADELIERHICDFENSDDEDWEEE